jgi:hypothetical protein
MRECDLMGLDFEHSFSEQTSPCGLPPEGYTEWVGKFRERAVSLSWSWTILSDSATQMTNSPPPTSNIMLIDDQGYDIGPAETTKKCREKIAQLQWTQHITQLQISG